MDPIVLRSIERILVVLFGGLSIYCGYRTFLLIPNSRDAEGRIELPGDISIFITRVGPGIFFALFGALVVGASFYFPVQIQSTIGASYSGLGDSPTARDNINSPLPTAAVETTSISDAEAVSSSFATLVEVQRQIQLLNQTLPAIRDAVPPAQREDVETSVRDIKLQLMWGVWSDDWGDRDVFLNWAKYDVSLPDSRSYNRARTVYELGLEGIQ